MAGSSGTLLLQQRRASSALRAAVPPLPPLAVVAVVVLLAAAAAAPAAAAPAWLFPPGTTKPPVIEGVQCPSNVVDVPNSAAFPPAPWAASATYRLTTAGAEYVLPNGGGPLVVGAGVTVCVVGTRATLRARNDVAFFDVEGGALGLSGVTLRGNGTGPTGVRLVGAAPGQLGAAQASFEQLFVGVFCPVSGSTAAFHDARFVGNNGGGARFSGSAAVFSGATLFESNLRNTTRARGCAGLYAQDGSTVAFTGPVRLANNSADVGAALYFDTGVVAKFHADVVVERCREAVVPPPQPGATTGVVYLIDARAEFYGRVSVRDNAVRAGAGAGLFIDGGGSALLAGPSAEFVANSADSGSGVYLANGHLEASRGDVRISGNRADTLAPSVFVFGPSTALFGPDTTLDVSDNAAPFESAFVVFGAEVSVRSRTASFLRNAAAGKDGHASALNAQFGANVTFSAATATTIADGVVASYAGAALIVYDSVLTFEGPTCVRNNRVTDAGGVGGAFRVLERSKVVFKDPPSSPASGGGGFGCKLPHPLFCPAGQQGQVMGDNSATYGPAAVVDDDTSAIVCASNGLTRGQGAWAIEGPVCGAACVAGGGNCTCPAGQPFSAADCACKGSKPLWPFPHPWLGGKAGSAPINTVAKPVSVAAVKPSTSASAAAMLKISRRKPPSKPAAARGV